MPAGVFPSVVKRGTTMADKKLTGSEIIIKALVNEGVDTVFGYPGGPVLPIYDAIFQQNQLKHVLVRQEGGAVHMAEGYARSTGKVGVVLVTAAVATKAVREEKFLLERFPEYAAYRESTIL